MRIARLPSEERPRERLCQHGVTALADAELPAQVQGRHSGAAAAKHEGQKLGIRQSPDAVLTQAFSRPLLRRQAGYPHGFVGSFWL